MSDKYEHPHHTQEHFAPAPAPVTPDDAGSEALAEAFHSSFAIVKFVMLLLVVLFLCSGFFTVGPSEKAIILRFGEPVGKGQKALLSSGWHWSFPYPIDEVVKIPITEIQQVKSTIGWYFMAPNEEAAYKATGVEPADSSRPSLTPGMDGYVISADRNIIHTRATLYYQVDDPVRYVFGFDSASNTVQNALNNALLSTAAHFAVDDILYNNRAAFQDAVLQRVSDLADQERLGISIDHCNVESMPPRQVKYIFDQVTGARENRNKILYEAHSYENQVTNNSAAQAFTITSLAISARSRYIQSLEADAKAFSALLPNYKINPDLFEQQQLVQVMGNALTNVQDKFFLSERLDGKPRELRLLLNREPPQPKTGTQARP
jgi:membrane protease subunit HflK